MSNNTIHGVSTQEDIHHETSEPSFFAIITADVRYCKSIEMGAKLLYAEITALCNKKGYCWSTNKYFADLYDVDERTIRRWLESLSNNEFIFITIDRNGFGTKRRIFLSEKNQKLITAGQKCPPGGTKISGGGDKNVLHNNTTNTTTKEVSVAAAPLQKLSVQVKPGQKIALSSDELFSRAVRERRDWTTEEISKAWNILSDYGGVVWDWWRFIEGTIDNIRRKIKSEKIIGEPKWKNKEKKKLKNASEMSLETNLNTPASLNLVSPMKYLKN